MAVGLTAPNNIKPIAGIELATISAGIYANQQRHDMALFRIDEAATAAAVFTRNRFCAAPVTLAKSHLQQGTPRYLLVNAGNANAGTGEKGMDDAKQVCQRLADQAQCDLYQVLPFSTGVIGEYLPVDKMCAAMEPLLENLSADNWIPAAEAIMTTDTIAKAKTVECLIGGVTITFTGIAKGAGMIRPDMATMLSFIGTDACIDQALLQQALSIAVDASFNCITVDGDTSTNDSVVLMATSAGANQRITSVDDPAFSDFVDGLKKICTALAQAIVRDGEGATKFVTIRVKGGASIEDCKAVAYQVAHSPLVKTALTAADANWGRILAAVGSAATKQIDINRVNILLGEVRIVANGERASDYTEQQGQSVMSKAEIPITIDLNMGQLEATVWTTDLSYEYIKINAEYRT